MTKPKRYDRISCTACYGLFKRALKRGRRLERQRVYTERGISVMYAIIKTGGKQYRVSVGDVVFVEKMNAQEEEI